MAKTTLGTAAGFRQARAWLQEWPVETPDGIEWLRTVNLGAHLDRLPAELQDDYLAQDGEIVGLDPLRDA